MPPDTAIDASMPGSTPNSAVSPLNTALASNGASRAIHWRQVGDPPRALLARADWLDAAQALAPASIDLLYVDPPFNTGKARVADAGAYHDAWPTMADYIDWLRERLEATLPALKPAASVLLHIDWRASHHARLLLDELLSPENFVNHIVWSYGLGGSSPRRFARKHDDILFYCVDPDRYYFDPPLVPATSRRMAGQMKKATDVLDIPAINNMALERTGWPTQKPLTLLTTLITACCPERGVVLDPCCGSGTTAHAAINTDRFAIATDQDNRAITCTAKRLRSLPPMADG